MNIPINKPRAPAFSPKVSITASVLTNPKLINRTAPNIAATDRGICSETISANTNIKSRSARSISSAIYFSPIFQ
jgi:hypothetical protein